MISIIKMIFKSIFTYINDTRAKHNDVLFNLPYVYLPCLDVVELTFNGGWQRIETSGIKGIINKIENKEYNMAA